MDADFIAYYKSNLTFLRQQSEIFAKQYPKIAQYLGLSAFECADPFVERLLEGIAFLAARNEQQLDQSSTFLLQDLLSCFAPALSMPHPAQANVHLTKLKLGQPSTIGVGSQFKSKIGQVDCKFSTLFGVEVTPITFSAPQQHFQLEDLLQEHFTSGSMKSALSLNFELQSNSYLPQDIELFLNMPELEAGLISQWLIMSLSGVFVQDIETGKVYPLSLSQPLKANPFLSAAAANAPFGSLQASFVQSDLTATGPLNGLSPLPSGTTSQVGLTGSSGMPNSLGLSGMGSSSLGAVNSGNAAVNQDNNSLADFNAASATNTANAANTSAADQSMSTAMQSAYHAAAMENSFAQTPSSATGGYQDAASNLGAWGTGRSAKSAYSNSARTSSFTSFDATARQNLDRQLQAAGLSSEVIARAFYRPDHAADNQQLYHANATPSLKVESGVSKLVNATLPYGNLPYGGMQQSAQTAQFAQSGLHETFAASLSEHGGRGLKGISNLQSRVLNEESQSTISAQLSVLNKPNFLQEILDMGSGMSYLYLYSAYPQLCKYCCLKGLGQALHKLQQSQSLKSGRLIFTFNTLQSKLNLESSQFLTNVVPLINIFQKRTSYSQLTLRSYYHLIPERTQPDDFEVIKVQSLDILGPNHEVTATAIPYFSKPLEPKQIFFVQQRHERAKGTFIPRSAYMKSECFVALCAEDFKPLVKPNLNLIANTYCSNADLPLFSQQGSSFVTLDEEMGGSMLDLKLKVEPALVLRGNQQSYALLSYFNLHVQSLLEQSEDKILLSIQEMLKAYAAPHADPELELLSHALIEVVKQPHTFRYIQRGVVFFEQGTKIDLYFDVERSGGSSIFFFASALCAMIQRFAPLNVQYEVTAYTKQGEFLATG